MSTLILEDKAELSTRAIEFLSKTKEPTVVIFEGREIGTFMPHGDHDPERYRAGHFKDEIEIVGDLNEPIEGIEWEVLKN